MCARKKQRKPWTVQEVRTLEQHSHEGIGNLKKLLPGRSEHAIKHTASRYGISLVRRWHCPMCNKETLKPLRPSTGWCEKCSKRYVIERNQERTRELKMKNLGIDPQAAEIADLERQLDATYQENSRLKRGLEGGRT